MQIVSTSLVVMVAGVVFGCSQEKSPPLTPAAGTAPSIGQSVEALASARCDREQRCGKIGPDKDHASRTHCMNQMRAEARDKLKGCKSGYVDESDLRECIGELRAQDCSGLLDSFESTIACSMDDLCDGD